MLSLAIAKSLNHSMGLCKAGSFRVGNEAGLGVDIDLIHQALAVVFDRLGTNKEGGSDLIVVLSYCD